jgi:general secretion pathway protein F
MPIFTFTAVDAAGRTVGGDLSAADLSGARRRLEQRRLMVLALEEGRATAAEPARTARPRWKIGGGLGVRRLALATRQLAALTAVSPVEEAVRNLADQAERPAERRVLSNLHARILEGRRLSDAMAEQGPAFPPLYRAMVAAGEQSGALQSILARLADDLEREQQARARVVTALVYPMVLAVVAVGVISALMIFVVPKVVDQFDSLNQSLPFLTRAVIGLSDFMRQWGWLVALALIVAGGAGVLLRRRDAVRLKLDTWILRAPVVGRLTRDLHAARMARTLSTMLASGLPVLEGLTITARTVENRRLRQATIQMAEAVREGAGLASAMRRAGVFPSILLTMTASGESAGRLEPMLDGAADYLERDFAAFTATMLSLLEPAIIVAMGAVVALIVLSILLPILQINSLALR